MWYQCYLKGDLALVWVLVFVQENFITGVQITMRAPLLKLGL